MLKTTYHTNDIRLSGDMLYHIQIHQTIIISSKDELLVFIKNEKSPKAIMYSYHKVLNIEWLHENIKYYFESLRSKTDQSEFIYGSIHGMINRIGEVTVTYF